MPVVLGWLAVLVLGVGLLLAIAAYGLGFQRGWAGAAATLLAEVRRLRDEVDRERCRAEYAEGRVDVLEKGFDPRVALLEVELLRLKQGGGEP
jgi:hypothetical protein